MKHRLEAARRVQAIQGQMRRLAEWQKQAIDRQSAAAEEESKALIAAFNGDEGPLSGLFVDVMARRLQRVAIEMRTLEAASTQQAKVILKETGREKHAAKLAGALTAQVRRADEDKALSEIVDAGEARRHASLK